MAKYAPIFAAVFLLHCVAAYKSPQRIPAFHPPDFSTHPNARANRNSKGPQVARCTERTRQATLDHFSWVPLGGFAKFTQRYFVCDEHWKNTDAEKGPIFLYIGNEAGVEKYIEATGLMWELAPEFGAMLVFIEHRYYGKSKPFGSKFRDHLEYLSAEQAIADCAEFLFEFQHSLGEHNLPVIGFGGSYGGMLGAWMRLKYPHALHGVIASSAPIWSFMGEMPPADPNYFDKIKTYAASSEAGAAAECVPNIKRTWNALFAVAFDRRPDYGLDGIRRALNLCPEVKLKTLVDIWKVIHWIDHSITLMAEGSYGFPSDYMTDGVANLPAYPLRLGCSYLSKPLFELDLLEGVKNMVEIYYNVTKDLDCFTLEREVSEEGKEISDLWSHQYCTEMFQMFGSDGVDDMFWEDPWDPIGTMVYCEKVHKTEARPFWATQQWGGKDIYHASNIVFSNGEYDPWRGGGVGQNLSDTAVSIIIREGGHHADLMFSTDQDNESLRAARQFEKESIAKWVQEVRDKNKELQQRMEDVKPEPLPATASTPAVENLDIESDTADTLGSTTNAQPHSEAALKLYFQKNSGQVPDGFFRQQRPDVVI